jgi:uncharacterized protein YjdB
VEFTWSSDAPAVALVDPATGVATAAGNGVARITATTGSVCGGATLTVAQAVTAIDVAPSAATLSALEQTLPLAASARDANGYAVPGVAFQWESADPAVATVDPASGLTQAVGNGTVAITATADGVSGAATVTVRQRAATVVLSAVCPGDPAPGCDTLSALGDQTQIVAQAFDANGHPVVNPEIVWATEAAGVATVDGAGLVTAAGNGTATITASADDAGAGIAVVVRQVVDSVTVEPAQVALAVGAEAPLTARAFDANGYLVADAVFTWTALNPAVAQVDGTGLVTALSVGFTKVRARTGGLTGEALVTVR